MSAPKSSEDSFCSEKDVCLIIRRTTDSIFSSVSYFLKLIYLSLFLFLQFYSLILKSNGLQSDYFWVMEKISKSMLHNFAYR